MPSIATLLGLIATLLLSSESQTAPTGPFLHYKDIGGKPYTVSADERSWIINGKRTLLLGGSIHYPRLSPGQWKDILTKMLNDGLNHAEIYVFWNIHEPLYDFSGKHTYNYEGRANLAGFLAVAAEVGLFINLRIGPYVCAEWSFGGLPTWLLHVPGIEFRADNQPWENYMQTFVQEIAKISEPYLAKNGGPIILAQIENEYGGSQAYVDWCGKLVTSLNMGVSWVMCNGMSASDTINTCNGNNCYNYAKSHGSKFPRQPLGWTENEGWFQSWSGAYNPNTWSGDNRSPQDMAYSVAIWFAAGAAHHNYYMWYGGNHVSWTAGSGITNMYADGVNYHSDGLANEPKTTHLMRLHNILSEYCEYALMESPIQIGNEIPLTNTNGTLTLMIEKCDSNNKNQQWKYDSSSGLLQATSYGNSKCVVATGNSDPVKTTQCNANDKNQQWTYKGKEFQSKDNSCLDVFGEQGPNIDEWPCKSSSDSDAKNQQWTISGSQITSDLNGQCLSLGVGYSAFAYQYHSKTKNTNITFLINTESASTIGVWNGKKYNLIGNSVIILDNSNNILFNTSNVNSTGIPTKRTYQTIYSGSKDLKYTSWTEILPLYSNSQKRPDYPIMNKTPLEQIRFTNDTYEYLFYTTNFTAASSMNNVKVNIVGRKANAYIIYIDNNYVGQAWDGSHSRSDNTFDISISGSISAGKHTITIISSSLGIDNGIANQQPSSSQDMKGIVGSVKIGTIDVTNNGWDHWIGRSGEVLNVAGSGMNKVQWNSPVSTKAMSWYKTTFATPDQVNNDGSILVDIGSKGNGMKRGHWWLNGMDMGHYNNVILSNLMVQQYYFIPNDYLTANKGQNTLIFSEELSNVNVQNVNIVYSVFVVP